MQIAEALAYACAELEDQLETPRLDAEVLLAHVLGKPRSYALTWPEKPLPANFLQAFKNLVRQRQTGIPIAYLVGEQEFWCLNLSVGPGVLVPRADTELLVELALQLELPSNARVADLGTGSGAIALALATERAAWQIDAVDCHPAALDCAEKNRRNLALNNVRVVESSWCSELAVGSYDLLISNPPYIAKDDAHLTRGGLQFEPLEALAAGEQGMDDLHAIIAQAKTYLRGAGKLLLEHGYDQSAAVEHVMQQEGWQQVKQFRDLAGHLRATQASL